MSKKLHLLGQSILFVSALSSLVFAATPQSAQAQPTCLKWSVQAKAYEVGEGDACQGAESQPSGETNTGPFRLTSFSLGKLQGLDSRLTLTIPRTDTRKIPTIRVQAPKQSVFASEATLDKGEVELNIGTSGLKEKGIDASNLRALSWLSEGTQFSYVPLLFAPKSKEYNFVFYSQKPVKFPEIKIIRLKDNATVYSEQRLNTQSSPEIFLSWKGGNQQLPGSYELKMSIEQEGQKLRTMSFVFLHNYEWTK